MLFCQSNPVRWLACSYPLFTCQTHLTSIRPEASLGFLGQTIRIVMASFFGLGSPSAATGVDAPPTVGGSGATPPSRSDPPHHDSESAFREQTVQVMRDYGRFILRFNHDEAKKAAVSYKRTTPVFTLCWLRLLQCVLIGESSSISRIADESCGNRRLGPVFIRSCRVWPPRNGSMLPWHFWPPRDF